MIGMNLVERELVPDWIVRVGIRHLLKKRLKEESLRSQTDPSRPIQRLSEGPIAEQTQLANEQHYDLPPEFFRLVLGKHMKYSCALWDNGADTLDEAERSMLELYLERAGIADGQQVLDLGCGWGSFSLYAAQKYPGANFVGVSNSKSQRAAIDDEAQKLGLTNLKIITCDINNLDLKRTFDRCVSIEMFEHMRNYRRLLNLVARHLNPSGQLFVHIFTHRRLTYFFDVKDETDWMSRYFFSGGIMPAVDLFNHFQEDLQVDQSWTVNGNNYARTAKCWLANMDRNRSLIMKIFREIYGPSEASKWFAFWRVFFLSCAELWAFRNGMEWQVSHYLLKRPIH